MSEEHAATEILIKEHSIVGVVIAAMEREAQRIQEGGEVDGEAIERMIEFTRGFTHGCHHAKEERLLFPRLLARGPESQAHISDMLKEHEAGRARIAAIAGRLDAAREGDATARRILADSLSSYASLLRSHIAKENNVLFPLADRVLEPDDQLWLSAEFERVEQEEVGAGQHERFHALAHQLSGEDV